MVARLAHNQEVVGSNPTVRNQGTSPPIKVIQVVLYTDLLFQLPPMRSEQSVIGIQRSMWLAAKDHSKINEGEAKEISYGSIVKRPKTPAFHVGDTGSNPVGATNRRRGRHSESFAKNRTLTATTCIKTTVHMPR